MEIDGNTSPELAIKIAYDSARRMRNGGADPDTLPNLLKEFVEDPYRTSTLLTYIRAGFCAGFRCEGLPWRRQIDIENRS